MKKYTLYSEFYYKKLYRFIQYLIRFLPLCWVGVFANDILFKSGDSRIKRNSFTNFSGL